MIDFYHTGLDVLGARSGRREGRHVLVFGAAATESKAPVPVCVQEPWWGKAATVIGAGASVATLWMAWNWHSMMKKRSK